MTVVNTATGEVVDTIGADEARRLTTEARNEFRSSREHFDRAWSLIEQAVEGGGHLDLGYRSPSDYLHAEFDGVLSGLDVPSRRTAVRTMTDWGLSTRAIAAPLDVSDMTVRRDQVAGATDVAPAQTSEASASGAAPASAGATPKVAPVEEGDAAAAVTSPTVDATAAIPEAGTPASARPAVTGIDGKTYTRPAPRQAQRDDAELLLNRVQSLADQAAREASKVTASQVARIKPKADLWTVGLRDSLETLQRLLTSLTEEK